VDDSFGEWAINIFFWVTSIALFYCLLKERMWNLAKESNAIGHIFIGLVFGVILSFFLKVIPGYVAGLGITISESSLINFFTSIIIDLQHSAIFEELLFRGFLVGYLTKNGISEKKILFIQSFLFWIAHVSIISQGFGFFIALPLGSIVLGYLAQKHKSILPSLLAHILYNSFDYFIS
jgi:membrane protease YdiL (CAAX protease family)